MPSWDDDPDDPDDPDDESDLVTLRAAAEDGDPDEMIRWYVRGARAGSGPAIGNLANCRREGDGERQDARSALRFDLHAQRESDGDANSTDEDV